MLFQSFQYDRRHQAEAVGGQVPTSAVCAGRLGDGTEQIHTAAAQKDQPRRGRRYLRASQGGREGRKHGPP